MHTLKQQRTKPFVGVSLFPSSHPVKNSPTTCTKTAKIFLSWILVWQQESSAAQSLIIQTVYSFEDACCWTAHTVWPSNFDIFIFKLVAERVESQLHSHTSAAGGGSEGRDLTCFLCLLILCITFTSLFSKHPELLLHVYPGRKAWHDTCVSWICKNPPHWKAEQEA